MNLTIDRTSSDIGIPLTIIVDPGASRHLTGFGLSEEKRWRSPSVTMQDPEVMYLEASQILAGSYSPNSTVDNMESLEEYLSRDWMGARNEDWEQDLPRFVPPAHSRKARFRVRRVFLGVPSPAGSED